MELDMKQITMLYSMVRDELLADDDAWANRRVSEIKAKNPLLYWDICQDKRHKPHY